MPGARPIETPDGKYIIVRGRLWRKSNPALSRAERDRLTRDLMAARRAVGTAIKAGDKAAEREARKWVDQAKHALGERGPVWWGDGAPDYGRMLVRNTPYARSLGATS